MNADLCVGFSKTRWEKLSQKLDDKNEGAWAEAIGVFERRMRERFFSSVDALFAADTKPDLRSPDSRDTGECIPGFSILALCCLLIETLQGFREKRPSAAAPVGKCAFPNGPCIKPPSGTSEQIKSFLRRPSFGATFYDDELAKKFVDGLRNGILHEAETRKWVIWRVEPANTIAAREDDGFVLNRSLFYAAVKKEFESYLRELGDPTNKDLRKRFKKKMDDLCRET
jgi:hypothetical protein